MNNSFTHLAFWFAITFIVYALWTIAAQRPRQGDGMDWAVYLYTVSGLCVSGALLTYFYISIF